MVTVTNNGNYPQQPLNFDNSYIPDQLIAGVFPRVTYNATITSGATVNSVTPLPRGTVMGQQTIGAATAVAGTNTGNGTSSAVTLRANAKIGAYKVTFTSATAFTVFDPTGLELLNGSTGVAYTDEIGFTITAGGTAFVAGDTFTITVAAGTGNYIPSVATATDGSQVPSAILVDITDPSGGAVNAGIYQTGEFNQNAITFDSSWTVSTLQPLLAKYSIFLKTASSAAAPS